MVPHLEQVALADIRIVPGISQRLYSSDEKIEQYSEAAEFLPPIHVFREKDNETGFVLGDGHLRYKAFLKRGFTTAEVVVEPTTSIEEGTTQWIYQNTRHGNALTNKELNLCATKLKASGKNHFDIAQILSISPRAAKMYSNAYNLGELYKQQFGTHAVITPSLAEEIMMAPQKYWTILVDEQLRREKRGDGFTIHGKNLKNISIRAVVSNLNDDRVPEDYRGRLLAGEVMPMRFDEAGQPILEFGNIVNEASTAATLRREAAGFKSFLLKMQETMDIFIDQPLEAYQNHVDDNTLQLLRPKIVKYVDFLNRMLDSGPLKVKLHQVK